MTQNNKGHQSLLRWHIADNVPFQKSFEGCIEKYFKQRPGHALRLHHPLVSLARWRDPLRPGAGRATRRLLRTPRAAVAGLKVLNDPHGNVQRKTLRPRRQLEERRALWWTGAQPKDKLELALPVARAAATH